MRLHVICDGAGGQQAAFLIFFLFRHTCEFPFAGAEDAVRALWSSLRLSQERGVEKAEFVVAGKASTATVRAGGVECDCALPTDSTLHRVDQE